MNPRVLVTYATWSGSTGEVAEAVGETMRAGGTGVDVLPVRAVETVDVYQAVVLGTPVRLGKPHNDALAFLRRFRQPLASIRTAFFIVCLTMMKDTPDNRCTAESYLDIVRRQAPEVQPLATGLFAGVMIPERLSFPLNTMMAASKDMPRGDFRDWAAVRVWAYELKKVLLE